MSGIVSRFLGGVEQLPDIALRLQRVQIENRSAISVIKLYDSKDTLFYLDPPYIHGTRGDSKAYAFEMTDDDHRALADKLNSVKGMVAISNYDCDLMEELYPAKRWKKFSTKPKTNHATKGQRVEVLWTNYDPSAKTKRPGLFE